MTLPLPPAPYLKLATYALALLVGAGGGWKLRDADYQRHLREDAQHEVTAQQRVRQVEHRAEDHAQQARDQVARATEHTRIVYQTVTKEVPVYVTQTVFAQEVDASGGLPSGLVWLHNQAAANSTAPLPSSIDPGAPAGVGVSELASVLAGNYALCHQFRAEAEGWRSWYELNRALFEVTPAGEQGDEQ